jgi:hypothetical protein
LQERRGIIYATRQGLQVDAREGIHSARVAANVEELRIIERGCEQVNLEERDRVLVTDGALVPVVGNPFPAFGPCEVARCAGDREEGLEDILVEDALDGMVE